MLVSDTGLRIIYFIGIYVPMFNYIKLMPLFASDCWKYLNCWNKSFNINMKIYAIQYSKHLHYRMKTQGNIKLAKQRLQMCGGKVRLVFSLSSFLVTGYKSLITDELLVIDITYQLLVITDYIICIQYTYKRPHSHIYRLG